MTPEEKAYKVAGWPAFILCFIPMMIGWTWIVVTLAKAVA